MPKPLGLYVHIPFCAKKCPYCDFYSVPFRSLTASRYTEALVADMLSYKGRGLSADTLYFGGGTPSLLSPEQMECVIATARESFSLEGEITMEANPNTVTPQRLRGYRQAGINRLSFGMQSADGNELAALGRTHSPKQAVNAVMMAADAGFSEISLDLMLGTPYQTRESARESAALAVSLPVTHLSAYLLKVERSTPYFESPLLLACAEEDELSDIYLETVALLGQAGFYQYEVSNFAKPGHESRHNLKYWRCEEYLGFGAAAHSFFQGKRYFNPPDVEKYASAGPNPQITDTHAGQLDEKLMLGLRLNEGIPLSLFEELPNRVMAKLQKRLELFLQAGFLRRQGKCISLTPKGFLLSNSILAELLALLPEE